MAQKLVNCAVFIISSPNFSVSHETAWKPAKGREQSFSQNRLRTANRHSVRMKSGFIDSAVTYRFSSIYKTTTAGIVLCCMKLFLGV